MFIQVIETDETFGAASEFDHLSAVLHGTHTFFHYRGKKNVFVMLKTARRSCRALDLRRVKATKFLMGKSSYRFKKRSPSWASQRVVLMGVYFSGELRLKTRERR